MKILSEFQKILVNLLLALAHGSCILILCVSSSQQDYTRDGNMTQNIKRLNLNKTNLETLRTWLSHISKDKDPTVRLTLYTTGTQRKSNCFKVDGFCAHFNTVFKAMGCLYHYCPCQGARSSLTEEDIERGNKKREMDQIRKQYIKEKVYHFVEMWECE